MLSATIQLDFVQSFDTVLSLAVWNVQWLLSSSAKDGVLYHVCVLHRFSSLCHLKFVSKIVTEALTTLSPLEALIPESRFRH